MEQAKEWTKETAACQFEAADADGDGCVTKTECSAADEMENVEESCYPEEEGEEGGDVNTMCEADFHKLDTNADQMVSQSEFYDHCEDVDEEETEAGEVDT